MAINQELSNVAKRRSKLIYESFQEEPDDREMLFQAAAMCHVFFPRREPDLAPFETWEQSSGKFVLYIIPQPSPDPQTGLKKYYGLPYGPKARVLLATLNTIAIQENRRTIEIAGNPARFLREIGLTDGGHQLNIIKEQMQRLANCVLRTFYFEEGDETSETVPIVTKASRANWDSEITLSQEYYNHLTAHPVPLAKSHLAALSNNATAIDLYCFLAHRLHRIPHGKPQFLAWQTIYEQFGGEYDRVRSFRTNFVKVWKLVKSVYTEARIEEKGTKGLLLYNSPTPIPKKMIISGLDPKTP